MSNPSRVTLGSLAPTRLAKVGNRSTVAANCVCVCVCVCEGRGCLRERERCKKFYAQTHVRAHTHACAHTHTHTNTQTHKHTHTHTHTHTPTSKVFPVLIFPGHHAMAGILCPPSHVVPFPQRRGPALPPLTSRTREGLGGIYK